MTLGILIIFLLVYFGMAVGRWPGLAIDRTGIALLGAIALLLSQNLTLAQLWKAQDQETLALLFGLMVLSSQFRLGGFYARLTRKLVCLKLSPVWLLGCFIFFSGFLSAVLVNDVVCLAVTPILIIGCQKRHLNPKPFLLALACSSNIGSAATLIGNPQNMLIGEQLKMNFLAYFFSALIPVLFGLISVWIIIVILWKNNWELSNPKIKPVYPPYRRWQTIKGLLILGVIVFCFLFSPWSRAIVALGGAGILLLSRKLDTRAMLGSVDWHLLILFMGLFALHHALAESGWIQHGLLGLHSLGIDPNCQSWLFALTVVFSNLVSNVPAVLLLLPFAIQPQGGLILALASTFAGNLFLVGSIANLIVAEQSARMGITISWREHARVGIPVTVLTLAFTVFWLFSR